MRAPSLYPQIKNDLKIIGKQLIAEEDTFLEEKWRGIKEGIRELAEHCKELAKQRRKERIDDI